MRGARLFASAAFAVASVRHLLACLHVVTDDDPTWRHAVFVVFNAVVAACFALGVRSRAFALGMTALAAQQLVSHGGLALRTWRDEGRVDVASVVVVVAMPFAVWLAFQPLAGRFFGRGREGG